MDLRLTFSRHVEDVAIKPHIHWGSDDCCLWVADIVCELCGIDLAEPFRDKYDTAEGAADVLRAYGGGGLVRAAVRRAGDLGLREIPAPGVDHLAVAVCANKAGPLLGVWNGLGWLVRTENGCAVLPVHWMTIAWELPECLQQ